MTDTQSLTEAESDAAVVARSLLDPAAFAEIFDRHWPRVSLFCMSRAGAPGEDIAAETFRIAFDERARFDGRSEAERLEPRLAAALNALSAADRDALLLLAWAEFDYEEIARATQVPVGTVRSRIHRARKRVRTHLNREDAR